LQTQLEGLHQALAMKDSQIEALKQNHLVNGEKEVKSELKSELKTENSDEIHELKEAFTALQNEQEDLLMMLSDQDLKLREYKKKLKNLGQPVSDEEDLEEDDDLT